MNYENRLDYFENNYEIIFGANFNETLQLDDRTDNQELKKCRFCKAVENDGIHTFNKEAHAISRCLGNKKIVSTYECDDCNSNFGMTIENDLSSFFSVARALFPIEGRKPSYTLCTKNPNEFIKNDIRKKHITIQSGIDSGTVQVDELNKTLTLTQESQSFKPYEVYRAFCKIFLTLIPLKYLDEAIHANIALNPESLNEFCARFGMVPSEFQLNIDMMARAHKLFIPGPSLSDAQIFRSKSGLANHPNFIFIIRIANYAYEFHYFDINKIITNAKNENPGENKAKLDLNCESLLKVIYTSLLNNIDQEKIGTPKITLESFQGRKAITNKAPITFGFHSMEKKTHK